MFGEGSETCVPVSGKAKRPAVRPSVDCPTYGQESGERQGPQLHVTDAPLGSFLVFPLARFLAVSAMADEVRFARSTDTAGATSSLPKVPEADSANEDRIHQVLGDCVLGSCGRISCTQTCGAQGPPGRAQSRPASCGKSTGLPCSILLIAGNLKPLWRSRWSIRYRQQQVPRQVPRAD